MISVTALSSYLYCPRKLYMQYVLEIAPPPKDVLVKGSIRHQVFDEVNKVEEDIITKNILKPVPREDINTLYRKAYYDLLMKALQQNKTSIEEVNLKPLTIFHEAWPIFLQEAKFRSNNIFDFIQQNKIFGKELWAQLTPKYITELKITSDKLQLKGVIDKIEVHNKTKYIPFEIKTGKMPSTGVWPGHKIQIIAYIFLMKEYFNTDVNQGYLYYSDYHEKREIVVNPFSEIELKELINKVNTLLNSKYPPPICDNRNKCNACGLKDKCYSL